MINAGRIWVTVLCMLSISFAQAQKEQADADIISYTADTQTGHVRLYWKNDTGSIVGSLSHLKTYVESKKLHLIAAMNGGMYKADHSPQGLFIQEGKVVSPADTMKGQGNFYMQPNGIFFITTQGKAGICKTPLFAYKDVAYATQSGPMLISGGVINSAFTPGSKNINIRNGVGILPDGKIVLAISSDKINFYDFAMYFKKLGCTNALYLDGFVSRMYLPQSGIEQPDGDFGVIIGVTDK